MGVIAKRTPEMVKQVSGSACWAAALQAWLQVTPGRKKHKQHELIDNFATDQEQDESIAPTAFQSLCTRKSIGRMGKEFDIGMEMRACAGAGVPARGQLPPLDWNFLAEKLRTKGHILMCYHIHHPTWYHCVVVYQINYDMMISMDEYVPFDQEMSPYRSVGEFTKPTFTSVSVLDPWHSGAIWEARDIDYWDRFAPILVGWPR